MKRKNDLLGLSVINLFSRSELTSEHIDMMALEPAGPSDRALIVRDVRRGNTLNSHLLGEILSPQVLLDIHHRSITGAPPLDLREYVDVSKLPGSTVDHAIKKFIQRYCRSKSANEVSEIIKLQHENFTCKICYEEKDSLFLKCKTCQSGEYHRYCMWQWAGSAYMPRRPVQCLLCKTTLL